MKTPDPESLLKQIAQWPMVPKGEVVPGRVVHQIVRHDEWCKTLKTGRCRDCNCDPEVTQHLQPRDAQ